MSLAAEDRKALVAEIVTAIRSDHAAVLTWEQAAAYVNCPSYRAFRAWCFKWHISACGVGRYARTKLDLGLQREARQVVSRRIVGRKTIASGSPLAAAVTEKPVKASGSGLRSARSRALTRPQTDADTETADKITC